MNNTIPNKKIRTIILVIIIMIYLGATIYVAVTKENNNLAGNGSYLMNDYYEDDYDDDDDDYYEDDYYDDDYDDYDYENGSLDINSSTVKSLYSYIKLYPYVTDIKSNFKVENLTQEEKMRLVAASLKSQNTQMTSPIIDVAETTLALNDKVYTITTPALRYERYQVVNMYSEIFGTSYDMDFTTIMYDGDTIAYKYNESANGYVKYETETQITNIMKSDPEIIKAEQISDSIEITLKTDNQTEIYIFEPKDGYKYIYKFVERKTEQKNSL